MSGFTFKIPARKPWYTRWWRRLRSIRRHKCAVCGKSQINTNPFWCRGCGCLQAWRYTTLDSYSFTTEEIMGN